MKKQLSLRSFIITISILVLIFGGVITFLIFRNQPLSAHSSDVINFEYGESMATFPVSDHDGNQLEKIPESDKYSLVFYVSDTCGGCMDVIKNFSKMESILGTDEFNYIVLWTDEVPMKIIDKYDINQDYCYSLGGKTRFATSTPSFYILDENQNVLFSTTDMRLLVSKIELLEIVPKEKLKENTIRYISENILPKDSDKKQLVYFEMEGCPDCQAANKVIDNSDEIKNAFEITRIYKYDDTDTTRMKDDYGLFKLGLDIQWYPSFLIFENGETRFIGEIPIEELQNVIMQ